MEQKSRGLSKNTIYLRQTAISRFLEFTGQQVDYRRVGKSRRNKALPLSREEFETLYFQLLRHTNLRNRALVALFLFCSLRPADVLSLTWADVQLGNRSGTLFHHETQRFIPLCAEACLHLINYTQGEKKDPTQKLMNIGRHNAAYLVEKHFGVQATKLRTTFEYCLIQSGFSDPLIAYLLGRKIPDKAFYLPDPPELSRLIQRAWATEYPVIATR
ncbi:phage integrase family protein [Melghirimyces profundicolus]|uniref:Phage integrase family protein n=1 Tax=Melghirimyces profundicolus TaxID=1242148 RepID=A0A2T6ATV1_9BACL|nr:site-specific integrase [Melghirimyces profundicolus]PTX47241.1 phage integrase family protein [Melghirimyces profundicolus]